MDITDAGLREQTIKEFFFAFSDEATALIRQKALSRYDCASLVSSFARIAADKWIALRDAALAEGHTQALADPKIAEVYGLREALDRMERERDAARAEMNIVKNRALEALTEQLIKDCDAALAVPCQRHGCMWDAPEAHEVCRAEQRERDAKAICVLCALRPDAPAVFNGHYRMWWHEGSTYETAVVGECKAAAIRSQR